MSLVEYMTVLEYPTKTSVNLRRTSSCHVFGHLRDPVARPLRACLLARLLGPSRLLASRRLPASSPAPAVPDLAASRIVIRWVPVGR